MKAPKLTRFLTMLAWTALLTTWLGSPVCHAAEAPPSPPAEPVKPVSIAALNRLQNAADAAFDAKDYASAVTKTEELIKSHNPQTASDEQMERLYFNLGLAHLLDGHFPEAEAAFTRCAAKYPTGLLASRCALGVGKACIAQDTVPKKDLAVKVLKVAMLDPRLTAEAGLNLAQLDLEMDKHAAALEVCKCLMGADIRSAGQTAAAVGVINLLADAGFNDLIYILDRFTNQAGVRDAIGWYTNQVIVCGDDAMMAQDFDTALALYQTVPSRKQILETQTQALESQRKTLASLTQAVAKEDEAEKANPNAPLVRSVARELMGILSPAIEANEKALTVIQGYKDLDAALVMRRGRCFYHLQRFEEARVCFSTLRLKYPTYHGTKLAAYTEIMLMQQLKKNADLLDLCKAYLAAYPDSDDAEPVATLAGELLVEQANWKEVATYYADLETRYPKSTNLDRFLFYQGYAHFLDADFPRSTPLFEKIISTFPKGAFYEPALYHVAMTYFLNNDDKKTLASGGEYLAKYPNGLYAGDIQYRISYIESNDKSVAPDKIIADLAAFLKTHPDDLSNGSMLCLLGDTYMKKTDGDKALAAYKKAVFTKSPDDVKQYALDCATTILQARKDWDGIAKLHAAFLKENP